MVGTQGFGKDFREEDPPLNVEDKILPVADWTTIGEAFAVFSTNRDFDTSTSTPWHIGGQRLMELFSNLPWEAPRRLLFAGQVHGNTVRDENIAAIENAGDAICRLPECDGLVTATPGDWLVIRTADCLPIALSDPINGVIGALHAGWRGTYGRIMTAGIQSMVNRGARVENLHVWIGPCISAAAYEVSEDLATQFMKEFPSFDGFVKGRNLDLALLNRFLAEEAGVPGSQIKQSLLCTWQETDLLHSHRRQGKNRGHQYLACGLFKTPRTQAATQS